MAPSGGSCTIASIPNGCTFYLLNYSTGVLTETALPYTSQNMYFVIKDENGNNVTAKCVPDGNASRYDVYFDLRICVNYDSEKYNIPFYDVGSDGGGTYDFVYGGFFNTSESNSIGNIPMGEVTFNGVQSVTYNGTDYTKLVVDGTKYPPLPVIISFTIAGTSYQAEDGMTWEEWITSKYNTSGLKISGSLVVNSSGSKYVVDKDKTVATAVNNHSIIIANKAYVYGRGTPEKE